MAKTIKIGGRLESVETGNIVAGANQIIDDDKNKRQSVINGEVDAELVRLDETKQGNLTFDNAPTEDSNNPVKSGGVYAADKLLSDAIEAILLLIPSAASALNKLVDMQTMNSSIATATATFRGTYNVVSDLELAYNATHEQIAAKLAEVITTADNNDYAFVQISVSATSQDIAKTERYKFNGEAWAYEYDLNNSGFTQAQWDAINSTITAALVSKLNALPTATDLQTALNGKQNNLTFDQMPTSGSQNPVTSGGIYARNAEIVALITALDTAKQDKLTFDSTPTQNSSNPVTSNGVYVAVSALQAAIVALDAAKQNVLTFDSTPTLGSNNPVTSSGIKTETNRLNGLIDINAADIITLNNLYQALTQSALVVVAPTDTWPVSNPNATTIYRVVDRVNTPPQYYSDYMWNGTSMVQMAQYDNAIDDEPTTGSENLVKSGGVFRSKFKMSELSPTSTTANSGILAQTGEVITDSQYMGSGIVKEYAINNNSLISIFAIITDFSDDYATAALYKGNVLVQVLGVCVRSVTPVNYTVFNNKGADTLKVCYRTARQDEGVVLASNIVDDDDSIFDETLLSSDLTQNSGILASDGSIVTSETYMSTGVVKVYSIKDGQLVRINLKSVGFNTSYALAALYRNGQYLRSIALCDSIERDRSFVFLNNYGADTLKICTRKRRIGSWLYEHSVKAVSIIKGDEVEMYGIPNTTLEYTNENHKTMTSPTVGSQIALEDYNYRAVAIVNVENVKGKLKIDNVLNTDDKDVVLVDKNGIILAILYNSSTSEPYSIIVDLDSYPAASKVYIERGPVEYTVVPAPVVVNYYQGIKERVAQLEKLNVCKGSLIFHIDSFPTTELLTLFDQYNIKVSWYISKSAFVGDVFTGEWKDGMEDLFKAAQKRGDDIALYPSANAGVYDEQGWKDFISGALSELANKGLYNITTFACGQLAINDVLFNAVKANGFKIIRGGIDSNVAEYNTYPYTDDNIWMPLSATNEKFIVNETIQLSNSQVMGRLYYRINYAINSGRAVSIFMHNDVDAARLSEFLTFVKNKVDAGLLDTLTWRGYYASVNRNDGHEWDYNRLLKMLI